MKPSRKEIEESVGQSIPDETPIIEVSSLPTPQEQVSEGVVFKFASIVNNRWKVFLSTKLGNIVGVYLLAITLGVDLPKPFPLVIYTYDSFSKISESVFSYLQNPNEAPEGYLVSLPPEYSLPFDTKHTHLNDVPIGSGIHSVSGSFLV